MAERLSAAFGKSAEDGLYYFEELLDLPHSPAMIEAPWERARRLDRIRGIIWPWNVANVPPASQRDPQYSDYYGHSRYTIHQLGCAMVCQYSLARHFGIGLTSPRDLNNWLKSQSDGYLADENGDRIILNWNACNRLWAENDQPRMVFAARSNTVNGVHDWLAWYVQRGPEESSPIEFLKNSLRAGLPVICHVDFDPSTPRIDDHFVLAVGWQRGRVIVNDPWLWPAGRGWLEPERVNGIRLWLPVYG